MSKNYSTIARHPGVASDPITAYRIQPPAPSLQSSLLHLSAAALEQFRVDQKSMESSELAAAATISSTIAFDHHTSPTSLPSTAHDEDDGIIVAKPKLTLDDDW